MSVLNLVEVGSLYAIKNVSKKKSINLSESYSCRREYAMVYDNDDAQRIGSFRKIKIFNL